MNYPFGEQIVFADAQPLISGTIKFISNNIVDISGYTIGIINFLMFFSVALAAFFISMILQNFKVLQWQNILSSTFIALLSPQLFRFSGHFGLAYCFIIPLVIWLWLWQQEHKSLLKNIVVALCVIMASLIHFYYFAIMSFFLALAHIFFYVFDKKSGLKTLVLRLMLQVVFPFLVLQLWLSFTSTSPDRPNNPFGFFNYMSAWEGILLPLGKPIGTFINHYIIGIRQVHWEGIAYVGLPAAIFVIGSLIWGATHRFKFQLKPKIKVLLVSGVFLLAFSMGIPFVFKLQFLLDFTGPLKQFRGIGRFAWVFFYIINFMFFIWFWQLKFKNKILRSALIVLLIAALVYEVNTLHGKKFYHTNKASEFLQPEINLTDVQNFSAIIPLPFYHVGSENIWYGPEQSNILLYSFSTAIKTGLPIMAVQMSRTSLSETIQSLQWLYNSTPPFPTISGDKNYLIVKENNAVLEKNQQKVFSSGYLIEKNNNFELRSISGKNIIKSISSDSASTNLNLVYQNDFENQQSEKVHSGKGALQGLMHEYTKIYETHAKENMDLTVQFYYYLNADVNPTVSVITEVLNNNEVVHYQSEPIFRKVKKMDEWALVEINLTLLANQKALIHLQKDSYLPRKIWVDDLVVYAHTK